MTKCVIYGCEKKLSDDRWCVCMEHWNIIPTPLRIELANAHCGGFRQPEFETVLARVNGWIRETFAGQGDKPRESWENVKRFVSERDRARAARNGRPPPPDFTAQYNQRTVTR